MTRIRRDRDTGADVPDRVLDKHTASEKEAVSTLSRCLEALRDLVSAAGAEPATPSVQAGHWRERFKGSARSFPARSRYSGPSPHIRGHGLQGVDDP